MASKLPQALARLPEETARDCGERGRHSLGGGQQHRLPRKAIQPGQRDDRDGWGYSIESSLVYAAGHLVLRRKRDRVYRARCGDRERL